MNSKLANIANALTVLTIALTLNACAVSGSNHANKTDRYLDETRSRWMTVRKSIWVK